MISKILNSTILTTWLFLLLYTPPLFSFNVLHPLTAISCVLLLQKYSSQLRITLRCRGVAVFVLGFVIALIFLFTTLVFTTRSFLHMYSIAVIPTEVLLSSLLFVFVTKDQGLSFDSILTLILNAALLQAVISILMFFIPTFKQLIVGHFFSHLDIVGTMSYWTLIRYNGLSEGLSFAMPVAQGFLASVAIAYSFRKSLLYMFFVPPLLFSAAVNARIGIVIFATSSVVFILMLLRKVYARRIAALVLSVAILVASIFFISNVISNQSNLSYEWIKSGFEEAKLFLSGETTGYFEAAGHMFFLPPVDILVFGSGKDYFRSRYAGSGYSSDIGYVNDLFLGGFFFVLALYSSFIYFVSWGKIPKHWLNFSLKLAIIITIILINFKGYAFRQSTISNVFVLISVLLCFSRVQYDLTKRTVSSK